MTYIKHKRYRTRKDIVLSFYKKFKVVLWFMLIALSILAWMYRKHPTNYVAGSLDFLNSAGLIFPISDVFIDGAFVRNHII